MQLEPQLGEPPVALLELATQLAIDFGVRVCRLRLGRRAVPAGAERLDQRVALVQLAAHGVQTVLVVLDLGVDGLGFLAPEVDLFLRELLGAGLGDLELLLELRHFGALGFGDLLEMAGLLLPPLALGVDALEPMRQDVELLLEAIFRRAFALQLLVELRGASFRFAERVLQQGDSLFG